MKALTTADRSFAIAITVRHFFEPLYKDYSIVGRMLGVIFRSARIVIGGAVYLLLTIGFAVVYLLWLAIPGIIIFYVAKNL